MSLSGPELIAKRRRNAAVVIAVGMALWFLTVPGLAVATFAAAFTLPGASPPTHEQAAESGTLMLVLAVVLVAPPAIGAVVGARNHRPVAATLCGLIAVVGLAAGYFLVQWGLDDLRWGKPAPAVTREAPPHQCIERSGGDTRCPGG